MSSIATLSFGWDLGDKADNAVPIGSLNLGRDYQDPKWEGNKPSGIADWLDEQDQDLLEVINHCHLEYTMHALVLKKSIVDAYQGKPEKMQALPAVSEQDVNEMQQAVLDIGLKVKGQPKWILSAYYS